MKSLKGTQTEKNILIAYSGESQARNRYRIWGKKAKEDGFIFVKDIFEETAAQEAEHARRLWSYLEGGVLEITGKFPAGVISDTYNNLIEAAAGEREEYTDMYPTFADIAQKEGFVEIATLMRNIAVAEEYHEKRYLDLAAMIKNNSMFDSTQPVVWRCLNCGFLFEGPRPPKNCPTCLHPQGYFVRTDFIFK